MSFAQPSIQPASPANGPVAGGRVAARAATDPAPDALMYLVALNVFTNVWRYQDMYPILGKIKLPSIAIVLVIISYVMSSDRRRKFTGLAKPVTYVLLAMYGLMVLGVPSALWPGKAFTFLTKDFGPTLAVTFVTVLSIRSIRDLEWLAKVFLYAGAFYALNIYLRFPVQQGGRLGGLFFYDANDLALLLVCAIPFAAGRFRKGTGGAARLIALFASAVLILTIVKSGSRGGFIAFMAVVAYLLFFFRAIPTSNRVGSVVFGVIMLTAVGSEAYWKQMQTIFNPKDDYNWSGGSPTGRMEVWKRAMGYIAGRPVLGVGARNFAQAEGKLSQRAQERVEDNRGVKWSAAHNAYVEICTEVGIPGFLLFLALLWLTFKNCIDVRRRLGPRGDPRARALADGITASLIGYMIASVFLSAEYFPSLYLLVAMAFALQRVVAMSATPAAAGAAAPAWVPAMPAGPRMRGGLVVGR